MASVIASLTMIPLGTSTPSVSKYIASALDVLDSRGLKYQLTPMCTILEGDEEEIFRAVLQIKKAIFEMGVKRVVYILSVDERTDKSLTMDGKVEAVQRHRK